MRIDEAIKKVRQGGAFKRPCWDYQVICCEKDEHGYWCPKGSDIIADDYEIIEKSTALKTVQLP